jgi:AcrR family transcriptional regulator
MTATAPRVKSKHRKPSGQPHWLTRDAILDAYIQLADREGPEAVTLRQLGAELGVDPTAVYRHFRDKEELLGAVADRLLSQLADSLEPNGDWRTNIIELAVAGRAMYMAHPRLAHVIATSPEPLPGNSRLLEYLLAALRSAGLEPRAAAMACEVIESYIAGWSSLGAEIGSGANDTWRRSFASLPAEAFPNAVALSSYLYRDDDASFRFGIELLLDAIAARSVDARGR